MIICTPHPNSKVFRLGCSFRSNEIFGCRKGCKSHNLLIYTLVCGERGIRTPGPVKVNGFQDRRDRPLCHLSSVPPNGAKAFVPISFAKVIKVMERYINFSRITYIHCSQNVYTYRTIPIPFAQEVYRYRTGIVVPRLGNAATMEGAVYAQNEAGTI